MFGLGMQEMLVLLMFGGMTIGAVLLVVFLATRGNSRVADLEADNRRLRDELDRRRT